MNTQIIPNKEFSDWYDSLPDGEPSYQETFEAGQAAALKAQPVNEWKEAMLDGLAEHCIDAPIGTPPREILEKIIKVAILFEDPLVKAQPVQPALTDAEFPELPRPDRNAWPNGFHDLFTAQQMRDYTQQATAPILAKLATQVALVEKCMVAMNENADRGEKAEAEVGRLVRKLALEREEFKAELDRIKAQPVQEPVCEYDETVGTCTKNPCCRTAPVQPVQPADGAQLWLWNNGNHMLAFDNPYPCYSQGGDPMTLGEPAAIAVFRKSFGRTGGAG